MSQTPEDALQGYFDDLLLEPAAEVSLDQGDEPTPQPMRQVAVKTTAQWAKPVEDYEQPLEQQAKDKVARLLASASPAIAEAVVTEPVVSESIVSEPLVAEEPAVNEALVEPEVAPVTAEETLDTEHQALKAKLEVVHEEVVDEAALAAQELAAKRVQQNLVWCDNGRPNWAQERFDVLLFSVSGLTLAVPLISLGQIQPLTDELTPLFGQADWFMGLQPTPVGKVRTINTAKFVMPERYDERFLETARYVISIDGVPWGLAVDEVNQPITLEPEDVKWRGERTKRAWLAGTVKQHMCALIDIPVMGQLLEQEDRNRAKAG